MIKIINLSIKSKKLLNNYQNPLKILNKQLQTLTEKSMKKNSKWQI